MVAVLDSMVFAAGFAVAAWVFAFTLVPALPRIAALLRGLPDPALDRARLVISDPRVRARTMRPATAARPAAPLRAVA
jgi:hypothetical protein